MRACACVWQYPRHYHFKSSYRVHSYRLYNVIVAQGDMTTPMSPRLLNEVNLILHWWRGRQSCNGVWRQPCNRGLWFEVWIVVLYRMHALRHACKPVIESDLTSINFETSIIYHVPYLPICGTTLDKPHHLYCGKFYFCIRIFISPLLTNQLQ